MPATNPQKPAATGDTPHPVDEPAGQSASEAGHDEAGEEGQAARTPPTPEAQIEILHMQLAEVENARLRAYADTENLRKRMEKEIAAAHKYAATGFATDIVPLLDTFQRAIASVTPEDAEKDPALKSLRDGVVVAEKQFLTALERHGIKKVSPKDEPFNPHFHQAIAQVQNPDIPAGTVMEVAQPGFVIEDRLIRPAMVVVAQGGMKAVKPVQPAPPAQPTHAQPVQAEPAQAEPVQPAPEPTAAAPQNDPPPAEETGEPGNAAPTEEGNAAPAEEIDAYEVAARRFKEKFGAKIATASGGTGPAGAKGTGGSAGKLKRT